MINGVEDTTTTPVTIDVTALLDGAEAHSGHIFNLGSERFGVRITLDGETNRPYWIAYGNKYALPCDAAALTIVPWNGNEAEYAVQVSDE